MPKNLVSRVLSTLFTFLADVRTFLLLFLSEVTFLCVFN